MVTTAWMLCAVTLVASLVEGKDAAVMEVYYRQSLTLSITNYTMKPGDQCFVETPSRMQPLQLSPITTVSDPRMKYIGSATELMLNPTLVGCGVKLGVVDASLDTGKWRLVVINANENVTQEFVVRVVEPTRNVVPKETVTIVEGQSLFLRFEQFTVSDLVECRVNWTGGRDVVLRPGVVDDPLVQYWGSGLEDECGVQAVNVAEEDGGGWTLRALNSTGHVLQGDFSVHVINASTYEDTTQIIIDKKFETIDLGPIDSKYCQSSRPNGEKDELLSKPCSVVLTSATRGDGGKWSAKFAVAGQVHEAEVEKTVQVLDMETMQTNLTNSTRFPGGFDLLCRWSTHEYAKITAKFCRFVRPDGVAFSLEDGVGGADYSYFGEGVNYSDNVKYCGMTIRSPALMDVGIWQCVIGVSFGQLTKGAFIEVPALKSTGEMGGNMSRINITDRENKVSMENGTVTERDSARITVSGGENDVYVQNGTSFTLACRATVSLSYCWFRHPDKSIVAPAMFKYAGNSREAMYTGQGLGLGDCSMKITDAQMADGGTWTCNMGVPGRADVQVPITVLVSYSSIVAVKEEVDLKNEGSATINCHTAPKGVPLQYCRFVRPDGAGFGFTTNTDVMMGRYYYDGSGLEMGECGLKIVGAVTEDIGQWTCAAFQVTIKQEGRAQIIIVDKRVLGGGAIAGIAIACIAVVALTIGAVYSRYHKRNTD